MANDYEAANGLHPQGHTALAMTLMELTEPPVSAAEIAAAPEEFLHVYPNTQQVHAKCGSFYVAMKGGHNGESHNHNDVGQFVFGVGGRLAVADLGTATYTRETFGARRYENWIQNGFGHNPPVFDGVPQSPGREFRAGKFEVAGTPGNFTVTCDLTPAYPAELGLIRCERMLRFDGRRLTVTDSWRANRPLSCSVRLFHEGDGANISCTGGKVATGKLPLEDSNLRSAWGDAVGETLISAPATAEGKITYTIEG
ncbi:MAG: heparinase II/III family protein [Lentisphaeria bacterium]|nr:heparinase II/III family protein [Lentisphaeria bacterium]